MNHKKQSSRSKYLMLQRLFSEIRAEKLFIALILLLYVPILLASLAQPILIGKVVSEGYQKLSLEGVRFWASIYIGMVIIQACGDMAQLYMMQLMGQNAVRRIRLRLMQKVQRLPMRIFDRMPLGKILTKITNDVESFSELFSSGAIRIIGDLLFLSGTLIMLISLNLELSMAALSTIPFLVIGLLIFKHFSRKTFKKIRVQLSNLNAYLQEYISGVMIVRLFGQSKRVIDNFEVENTKYMQDNRMAIFLDATIYAFVDTMSQLSIAAVLWYAVLRQESGLLELGLLVAFIEALGRFFFPIRELSNKYTIIQSALVSAERIYELEDEDEINFAQNAKDAVFENEIHFNKISFAYNKKDLIIKNLEIRIKKGEKVAFVGQTGSGKSTLTKLLTRSYDLEESTQGAITIDGQNIKDLDFHSFKQLFSAVPQDVFLFSGTLKENLLFGEDNITEEQLCEAVAACGAKKLIDRHGGLETKVAERGSNFSLGERQIIALVRALLANRPILILDEATASVDRQSERLLQTATEKLMHGRTAIIVAHRLSTIKQCDRIFVINRGEVLEAGTHDQLMEKDGAYAKLVHLQLKEEEFEES